MLVEKDYFGKKGSRFKCDRCNAELTTDTRRGIYIQHDRRSPTKKWDLCVKCYLALKRGIERGV